jgi:hypothetical protein
VSFDKIRDVLPAFEPQWDVRAGATEMRDVFKAAALTKEQFEGPEFVRLRRIEELLSTGQIDESFYWTAAENAA